MAQVNVHSPEQFPLFDNTCQNNTSAATAVITELTQMISSRPDRLNQERGWEDKIK